MKIKKTWNHHQVNLSAFLGLGGFPLLFTHYQKLGKFPYSRREGVKGRCKWPGGWCGSFGVLSHLLITPPRKVKDWKPKHGCLERHLPIFLGNFTPKTSNYCLKKQDTWRSRWFQSRCFSFSKLGGYFQVNFPPLNFDTLAPRLVVTLIIVLP